RNDAGAIKTAKRDVADGCGDLAREIELARFAKGHRFAGVEKNADRQFAFLLVEFEEEAVETTVEIPIEIAEIVAGDVIAVIGKFNRLAARAAAAFALGGTFGAARREQLELFQPPQQFGSEEGVGHQ